MTDAFPGVPIAVVLLMVVAYAWSVVLLWRQAHAPMLPPGERPAAHPRQPPTRPPGSRLRAARPTHRRCLAA